MQLKDSLLSDLTSLVERNINRDDLFLVDAELKGGKNNQIFSVFVESDKGGVTLEDCAQLSRNLQTVIEAHELLGDSFTLNVSSPGISRPLKLRRQYKANIGRNAKISYKTDDGVKRVEGKLADVSEDRITLDTKDGAQEIDFSEIMETKIVAVV